MGDHLRYRLLQCNAIACEAKQKHWSDKSSVNRKSILDLLSIDLHEYKLLSRWTERWFVCKDNSMQRKVFVMKRNFSSSVESVSTQQLSQLNANDNNVSNNELIVGKHRSTQSLFTMSTALPVTGGHSGTTGRPLLVTNSKPSNASCLT